MPTGPRTRIVPVFAALLVAGCADAPTPPRDERSPSASSGSSSRDPATTGPTAEGSGPGDSSSEPERPGGCTPRSCPVQGADCGVISDGCGEMLDCGPCRAPETCGGSGVANVCGASCDDRVSCRSEGKDCGVISNGCGETLDCGMCEAPQTCGGGGIDNVCGSACIPVSVLMFDLGETLVQPVGGGMFEDRPGAVALIEDLKARSIRVGIITNVPPDWTEADLRDRLENPSLLDEFELVLLSSQTPAPPKPSVEIFTAAYDALEAPPPIEEVAFITEELPHIADAARAPTQGAKAAGMLGIHLSSAVPSPLADYTFDPDDLNQIVETADVEWLPCAALGLSLQLESMRLPLPPRRGSRGGPFEGHGPALLPVPGALDPPIGI